MAARGTSAWRAETWKRNCKEAKIVCEEFAPGVKLWVAKPALLAFHALFDVFRKWGYQVRPKVTGAYNCRNISGGNTLSAHAYGIAVDVNWDTNPYTTRLITDMEKGMISEVTRIRTLNGVQVWRWGGDWDGRPETNHIHYDAMHFEIIATPEELGRGIPVSISVGLRNHPTLRIGARGPAVGQLQTYLGIKPDEIFGPKTQEAVISYQEERGLPADGIVGPGTWTALIHEFPTGKIYWSK